MKSERDRPSSLKSQTLGWLCAGLLAACACGVCLGTGAPLLQQQDSGHDEVAPPPMRYLPADTRARLSQEHDLKGRTKISLEMAEQRLASAAQHTSEERFEAAASELGIYEAIVDDALQYIRQSGRAGKSRDIFKRIEMTLRSHVPRIETMRRTTPSYYAFNIKKTLEFVRDARTEALNSFYSDTVLPNSSAGKEKSPEGERVNGTEPSAPDAERKPQR